MTIKCFSVHATDATSEISKEEASDHDTVNFINTITAFYQEFGLSIRRWSASSLGVPSSSTGATVAVAEPSGRESAALTSKDTSPSVEISPRAASIPSSDDESDEGSVLQLVVSPVPPTKTGSESLQSSESSAKPPAASEPLVASDSPVRKSPASTHDQGPDHNFVDDVESDAESTSTLVFALGDEAKANTPTDSAVLPSVARGSSVETTSVAVDDSPPGESAAQDEAAILANKMPVPVPRLRTTRELWMFHRLFLSLLCPQPRLLLVVLLEGPLGWSPRCPRRLVRIDVRRAC
ncbi:hypothetical protein PC123_g16556 [Phytophthora cactorum]|nr:hypothetical protein PC123_g16556 [Phytophthora cactorum]